MSTLRLIAVPVTLSLALGCGLPPPYEPKEGERFITLVDNEHWTENYAAHMPWEPATRTNTQSALVTWHLGKEAPTPRAWWEGDHCLVTEGNWAYTEFSPPSHGTLTMRGLPGGDKEMEYHRNEAGIAAAADAWKASSQLSLKAAGDSLPAFDLGGTVPAEITLTTWDLEQAQEGDVSLARDQALALQWTPGSGEVLVQLMQYDKDPEFSYFHAAWCFFAAEAGSAEVPLDVMKTFVAQDQIAFGQLYFGGTTRATAQTDITDILWNAWNGRGIRVTWK